MSNLSPEILAAILPPENTMTPALAKALALHQPKGDIAMTRPTAEPEEAEAYRLLNFVRASLLDDDWPKKVYAFRRLYERPINKFFGQIPSIDRMLQRRLLTEEFNETLLADAADDLPETVDGLLDLIYIALGWLLQLGLTPPQINELMQEVHASNMTKTDDAGKALLDEGGKVLKGHNYIKADIALLLADMLAERPGDIDPA